jgi:hypothetical protein
VGDENRRLAAARYRGVESGGPPIARRTSPIAKIYAPSERQSALPERLPMLGARIAEAGQKEDGARPRGRRHGQGQAGIVLPKQAAVQDVAAISIRASHAPAALRGLHMRDPDQSSRLGHSTISTLEW